jgi:hypothetical protein
MGDDELCGAGEGVPDAEGGKDDCRMNSWVRRD